MKKTTLILAFLSISTLALAQQSMTISHSGLAPESEITVQPGEEIEFIYGTGGPHPMTEGWQSGETSTPIPFETVTVTSSIPSAIFTLETPGTYYFHCGTNPGNSVNWGKINVVDSTSSVGAIEASHTQVFPNPAASILNITGDIQNTTITDLNGKVVVDVKSNKVDISALSPGTYLVCQANKVTQFIKK